MVTEQVVTINAIMANFSVQIKPLVLVKINDFLEKLAVIGLLGLATGLSWQLIAFINSFFLKHISMAWPWAINSIRS
jgi:hypothetical protein